MMKKNMNKLLILSISALVSVVYIGAAASDVYKKPITGPRAGRILRMPMSQSESSEATTAKQPAKTLDWEQLSTRYTPEEAAFIKKYEAGLTPGMARTTEYTAEDRRYNALKRNIG
jgi:hypothetical protein